MQLPTTLTSLECLAYVHTALMSDLKELLKDGSVSPFGGDYPFQSKIVNFNIEEKHGSSSQ